MFGELERPLADAGQYDLERVIRGCVWLFQAPVTAGPAFVAQTGSEHSCGNMPGCRLFLDSMGRHRIVLFGPRSENQRLIGQHEMPISGTSRGGSDGTRTRDLRRDRPDRALRAW